MKPKINRIQPNFRPKYATIFRRWSCPLGLYLGCISTKIDQNTIQSWTKSIKIATKVKQTDDTRTDQTQRMSKYRIVRPFNELPEHMFFWLSYVASKNAIGKFIYPSYLCGSKECLGMAQKPIIIISPAWDSKEQSKYFRWSFMWLQIVL